MMHTDFATENLFSDIVKVDFNMFSPDMENRIEGQCNCTFIVTEDCRSFENEKGNILQDFTNPTKFYSCIG